MLEEKAERELANTDSPEKMAIKNEEVVIIGSNLEGIWCV